MSKAELIRDWLEHTDYSNQEIAQKVGCRDSYVRTVQQRLLGGGGSSIADRTYRAKAKDVRNAQQRHWRWRQKQQRSENVS